MVDFRDHAVRVFHPNFLRVQEAAMSETMKSAGLRCVTVVCATTASPSRLIVAPPILASSPRRTQPPNRVGPPRARSPSAVSGQSSAQPLATVVDDASGAAPLATGSGLHGGRSNQETNGFSVLRDIEGEVEPSGSSPPGWRINVLIPTTLPSLSTTGPPLLPSFNAASVYLGVYALGEDFIAGHR